MLIEQVQIEDGFLDDLDVRFTAGLNVLIGARGTGKTSLIELIRFALGATAFTEDAARRGKQQALNVLQGGQVTVVLLDGEDRFVVTRAHATKRRAPHGRFHPSRSLHRVRSRQSVHKLAGAFASLIVSDSIEGKLISDVANSVLGYAHLQRRSAESGKNSGLSTNRSRGCRPSAVSGLLRLRNNRTCSSQLRQHPMIVKS